MQVEAESLRVELSDGRCIDVPLAWYPRLAHASPEELGRWRLVGQGKGIHWASLDEDISVEALLAGRASGESQASLQRWLENRGHARQLAARAATPIPKRRKR